MKRQRRSNDKQIDLVNSELGDLRKLAQKALVPKRRLLALEREAERIRGQSEALGASMSRSGGLIPPDQENLPPGNRFTLGSASRG